jgi:hypothetical protein
MEGRLAGDVFMIPLSDLCDLRVKILLRPKPSGPDGRSARRGRIYIPLSDLCDLRVRILPRPKPSAPDRRSARRRRIFDRVSDATGSGYQRR